MPLVLDPRKPLLRLKVVPSNYRKILALANTVHAALTANLSFPMPSPTLIAFATDITALKTAMQFLGTKKNKGSKATVLAVKAAALVVRNDLLLLQAYVINTVGSTTTVPSAMATIYGTSGFAFRKVKAISDVSQIPTFARQTNNRKVPQTAGQAKWRKPLGLIKGGKITSYAIYKVPISPANFVMNVTKTNALLPQSGDISTIYAVVPFNARGTGKPFQITIR